MTKCAQCGAAVPNSAARCPLCDAPSARRTVVEPSREARNPVPPALRPTVIEPAAPTAKPVAKLAGALEIPALGNPPVEIVGKGRMKATTREPLIYRPLTRQPLATLVALDDGSRTDGETWRLRAERFVIGRVSGDAVIANDNDISAEHAEITCRWEDGAYRWVLTDLDSTNGTFVRVTKVLLRGEKELFLGGRRYAFRPPAAPGGSPPPAEAGPTSTHRYQGLPASVLSQLSPKLVELTAEGDGRTLAIPERDAWIGSDPNGDLAIEGDPFVSPRHARLSRDAQNRWTIEDAGSLNGLWTRVQRIPLEAKSEFQLGEQRFLFRLV